MDLYFKKIIGKYISISMYTVYTFIYTYIYKCKYIYIHIYTYIHTCTHIHTHTTCHHARGVSGKGTQSLVQKVARAPVGKEDAPARLLQLVARFRTSASIQLFCHLDRMCRRRVQHRRAGPERRSLAHQNSALRLDAASAWDCCYAHVGVGQCAPG